MPLWNWGRKRQPEPEPSATPPGELHEVEEPQAREVGEPEPDRRTVDRAPNGRFTSRKRM